MESLPEDIEYTIYMYKHQLEFEDVLDEMTMWNCDKCELCGQWLKFLTRCKCGGIGGPASDIDSEDEYDAIDNDSEAEYYDSDSYGDSDSDSDYDRYDPDGPLWMYSMRY
jgi:hypothetical protein